MLTFPCPHCHKPLKVKDELAGKKIKCPACGIVAHARTGEEILTVAPSPDTGPFLLPGEEKTSTTPRDIQVPGYEILGLLGRGGMGVVYKARHLKLKRLVALKMILSGEHAAGADLDRFRAEAEAVARIQHPNIVQIFEVGDRAGLPYFSLEFVEGGSLAHKLAGQPVPDRAAAQTVKALARAMHAAHQQGIIHRDLKPANVLLARSDPHQGILLGNDPSDADYYQPKITDFGLAKQLDADSGQTRSGAILGTPSYMAPEQAEGNKQVGSPADVYALGAILYELLTGRPPFRADTPLNTVLQVVADEPVPPSRLQSRVPRDLETICLQCLQKDPKKRYASALALAEDLGRYLGGEPIKARPTGAIERARMWARRRPAVAGLLATTITLFLVGFVLTAWQWLRAEEQRGKAVSNAQQAQQAQAAAEQAQADAESNAEKERLARLEADAEKRKAQRLLTILALDRSQTANSQGDTTGGLLWLARSLEAIPSSEPALEQYLRTSLAAWAAEQPPLLIPPLQQGSPVSLVLFSPNGKTILTCGDDGTVRFWETASGQPMAVGTQHRGRILSAAFSPNGRRAATGGQDQVACIWDTQSGQLIGTPLGAGAGEIHAVAFSPDGAMVATGHLSAALRRWDAATGQRLGQPILLPSGVLFVAFSPGGKTILTGSRFGGGNGPRAGSASLWNAATGEAIGETMKVNGELMAAVFSPDGKLIATGCNDRTLQLWDAASGKPVGGRLQHNNEVRALAFRPDSAVVAAGTPAQQVRLWNVRTGESAGPAITPPDWNLSSIAFSPDSKTLMTAYDKVVRFWDPETGKAASAPLYHPVALDAAAFSPNGQLILTGGRDLTARLRPFRRRQTYLHTSDHPGIAYPAAFTPDRQTLVIATGQGPVGAQGGQVRLIDLTAGRLAAQQLRLKEPVTSFTLCPDGKTIATLGSGTVRFWDLESGEPIGQPIPVKGGDWTLALNSDGRLLATGNAFFATLWDVQTRLAVGQPLRSENHTLITRVVFSPNGRLLATGGSNGARLWNTANGQPIGPLMEHRAPTRHLSFSRDGTALLTASDDGMARVWETATSQPRSAPMRHRAVILTAVFSPDNHSVLTASGDGTARLWDAATGRPIATPMVHQGSANAAAAFSPDGRIVITSGAPASGPDSAVRLWDSATGRPLGPPIVHESGLAFHVVAFAPDGNRFLATAAAIGSSSSTLRIWKTPAPLDGKPDRIRLWIETLTGTELNDDGMSRVLDTAEWHQRRQRLEALGGSPASTAEGGLADLPDKSHP